MITPKEERVIVADCGLAVPSFSLRSQIGEMRRCEIAKQSHHLNRTTFDAVFFRNSRLRVGRLRLRDRPGVEPKQPGDNRL
jgi:hypothetical protein